MPGKGGDWELDALRARLDALELRFGEETGAIRERIRSLEERRTGETRDTDLSPQVAEPEKPEPAVEPVPAGPPPLPPMEAARTEEVPEVGRPPEPEEADGSFELRFGRVWLVRIGIALLVTGLVLLGNYAYRNWIRDLPAGVRLGALYLCALALAETGRRLAKRDNLRAFGEVVMAGGLSFFYYCTFAAHHVPRLRVVESPVLAALLLALAAAGIAAVSWLRRAKGTAVLGIVLASYAVMLQPIGWMSCFSALVLAAMGLFFATRPGWNVPGWVSLLASYGAFVGWQFLGAAGGRVGEPVLWFLPFVWLMFALPAITGRFRDAMEDRARAWFTGVNNGLFFLLYSGSWLSRHGDARYWLVAAVVGAVWLACGVLGRRRSEVAGGTNVAQGLACLSLALVLKLDGWHLGLALAGEALALSIAFARFRGRSELAFALLAGVSSTAIQCGALTVPAEWNMVPAWSGGLAALVLAGASFVAWVGAQRSDEGKRDGARVVAAFLFLGAMVSLVVGWGERLDPEWRACSMLAVSTAMAGLSFGIDRKLRWVEPAYGALALLVVSCAMMMPPDTWSLVPSLVAVALAVSSCMVWRYLRRGTELPPPAWLGIMGSSVLTAFAVWIAVIRGDGSSTAEALGLCGGGIALIALGVLTRCSAMAPSGAALGLAASFRWISGRPEGDSGFLIVAGVVAMAALCLVPGFVRRIVMPSLAVHVSILRLAFSFAWLFAWMISSPGHWGEWMALSSAACLLAARPWKRMPPLEAFIYLALGAAWWMFSVADRPETSAPAGWAVVVACVTLLCTLGGWAVPRVKTPVAWMTVVALAVWTTRATVVAFDGWKPIAVSWTLLGFLLVSAGLVARLLPLRMGGFLVLGAALLRVFAVDVWDFNAFLRVVAFIVLGVALLLLGLFYHRFAPVLKSLFEDERRENLSGETRNSSSSNAP